MKVVGDKLENIALSEKDFINKDLFGRSAFNRYYYASFLITREMLSELDQRWKHTPHKNIPDLLKKAVRTPVVNKLKQDARADIITNGELSRLRTKLNNATSDLANLLSNAYDVRILADYEPEMSIIEDNKTISLDSHKLTTAKTWADKTNIYCKEIRSVWRSTGLA